MKSNLQRHSNLLTSVSREGVVVGPNVIRSFITKAYKICLFAGKTLSPDSNLKFMINGDVKRKKVMYFFFQIDNNFPWYIYSSTDHKNDVKMFKN